LLHVRSMAIVHRLPVRTDRDHDESILSRLVGLAKLELELGLAETRDVLVSAAIAVAVAVPALILLLAALVTLVAAAFAPLFGAAWEHLVIAGGGIALLSGAAVAWSAWRLTHLSWPKETVTSFQENWRWLGAQLRSRLTLR
jgi:putative superfamily III holin-X